MIETLGHYKILERIGAGGLGEVYRARDTRLGRTVAIKVIPPELEEDAGRRERFLADARAAMAVSHPNIAALYEIGDDRGLFLVYEFAPGETLKKAIAGHPLNPRRAVDLAIQIADALADAHAQGVVHGDIRPDNIIETPKGAAKILDFGLSAWTRGGAARRQAAQLNLAADRGEPDVAAYLSPEQAVGEPVDHRTDIFSFGTVAFEMFTGRQPFVGATPAEIALQIAQAKPPRPTDVNKSLPREFDQVIGRALAKSARAAMAGVGDARRRIARRVGHPRGAHARRRDRPRGAPRAPLARRPVGGAGARSARSPRARGSSARPSRAPCARGCRQPASSEARRGRSMFPPDTMTTT